MLSDKTVLGILLIVALILALTLHEWAHAAVATARGDRTAKDLGRLTINPIRHMDPFMTVLLPAFLWFVLPLISSFPPMLFGGAKPVPVDQSKLRSPHRDMMLVAAAGPLMNFFLAVVAVVTLVAIEGNAVAKSDVFAQFLLQFTFFNVLLGMFNLAPIPPLDGSRIVAWLLPPLRPLFRALERIGLLIVIAVVFMVPGAHKWLFDVIQDVYAWLLDTVLAAFGYS